MFGLLKAKNPYEQEAAFVYSTLLTCSREPLFYKDLGIEDTFEGRFELLTLHVFMVMHVVLERNADEEFSQALFDAMFADMDQALRETGKGDMSVPKHMRRMMTGFNGRIHAYHESYGDDAAFEEALVRNLYGGTNNESVARIRAYIQENIDLMLAQNISDIMEGHVTLSEVR